MPLRVRLLGRPGLKHDVESLLLDGHKPCALLTYLLLEPRAPTRRELADLLWSEADDPLGAVRWSLSQVRKAVNPPAEIGERDGRIKIDAEVLVVDAGELLRGEWDETSIDDLVRGELLEGMSFGEAPSFDTWLQVQRARVATSAADALRWAATLLSHREPDRALALAERALRSEPFDDALHELIVEIHAARGDRERARTYVAGLTRRYRDELAIEPPASISRPLERAPRSAAEPLLRLDVQARALLDIARVRFWAGDFASARDIALRTARQAGESGDRALEARALILGSTTYTGGGLGAAREGLLPTLPWALVQAGDARLAEGDLDGATERFSRALTIAQETRNPSSQALALRGLALIALSREDVDRALTLLREALTLEDQ